MSPPLDVFAGAVSQSVLLAVGAQPRLLPRKLGPIELKVEETKRVNVPMWAGVAAIALGGVVLLGAGRK